MTDEFEDFPIEGRCLQMCPLVEMMEREKMQLIHPLEAVDLNNFQQSKVRKADPNKMVKAYRRPAAGMNKNNQSPSLLRPFPTLSRTVDYLLKLSDESIADWSLIYGYVNDRLRAVRGDIIIQRLEPQQTKHLLEQMIPFYFQSNYKCNIVQCSSFDQKLHKSQLEECLSRWFVAQSICNDCSTSTEETKILYLIYRIWEPDTLLNFHFWKPNPISEKWKRCFDLILSLRTYNFVKYVKLLKKSDYMEKYVVACHLPLLRWKALQTLSVAYKSKNGSIPIEMVKSWLGLDTGNCEKCCLEAGLEVKMNTLLCEGKRKNDNIDITHCCWNYSDLV